MCGLLIDTICRFLSIVDTYSPAEPARFKLSYHLIAVRQRCRSAHRQWNRGCRARHLLIDVNVCLCDIGCDVGEDGSIPRQHGALVFSEKITDTNLLLKFEFKDSKKNNVNHNRWRINITGALINDRTTHLDNIYLKLRKWLFCTIRGVARAGVVQICFWPASSKIM